MEFINWLKKILDCKEEEYKLQIDNLNKELEKYKPAEKETYYNTKYPQVNLTYLRHETDGDYQIDLRNFINPFDSSIPIVEGKDDDEKALNGLLWVIQNIKYISDSSDNTYKNTEYWAYPYQTLKHKAGDCEDGSILLYNILLKSGIPYWKIRLSAGWVKVNNKKEGHCYLTYYCEKSSKWVVLDWCYWPNLSLVEERKDYKEEENYLDVWFSWNMKYCFTKGLNDKAQDLLNK